MEDIIKHIVNDAAQRGHDVTIRNVAYALMRVYFDNPTIAYTVINCSAPKQESDVVDYDSMSSIQYLIHWFKKDLTKSDQNKEDIVARALKKQKENGSKEELITSEENFAGAVEQLKRVKELRERCDKSDIKTLRDLEKMELEVRVKLVDKWDMQKEEVDEKIITPRVYDYVCPWTRHECYQIGKEEAMEKWNLIEKD
ncbi:hypothetical protein [Clavibacter sp.]|uniref:hypothetical protein n=1 Tax=Clavibacter sp. TaxID=1871044 RepID=UPI00199609A9|nr:hypothetical protein [Clavibacter sp.]MBD5381961.1 hypothetical protein [Clavibacter sp.]